MRSYNGAAAHTAVITAGTELWRVHRTNSDYAANSFNADSVAELVDALQIDPRREPIPRQGRFDPVHDDVVCPGGTKLGGYLYAGCTVGAVVAEGILRATAVPHSKIMPSAALTGLSLTRLVLRSEVTVAILDTQAGLTAVNQDASLTGCTWREYRDSRVICTDILVGTPKAHGVRYRCRHGLDERAVMLVQRSRPPEIEITDSARLDRPGWAYDRIEQSLFDDFGLVLSMT